jgi:hypothetical protein
MFSLMRRLFWLGVLGGGGYAAWTTWHRRSTPVAPPAPEWPPMPNPAPTTAQVAWRDPVDGGCPDGFPVKVNAKSGIFHVPGGRFYDRTVPDRCYPDPAAAEADGYRAAKS